MNVPDFSEVEEYPVPRDPCAGQPDDRRLWVGNLDTRVTEFALLKLLQKHGSLEKFDFLYHKAGPDLGKPRGYCFVTYSTREEAERARQRLHGKLALDKRLVVKYAHIEPQDAAPVNKVVTNTTTKQNQPETKPQELSTEVKIRTIEAKLKLMERSVDPCATGTQVSSSLATIAPWTNPSNPKNMTTSNTKSSGATNSRHSQKPYQRGSNHYKSRR